MGYIGRFGRTVGRTPPEVREARRRERPTVLGMAGAGSLKAAVMEAVRALEGALAARGTNEATALKQ